MSHGHCQCGQISWKIDVMMSHLVILHISWNSKSPSTYFTFSRNMTCHFTMVHIHKIKKKSFKLFPHSLHRAMASDETLSLLISSPPIYIERVIYMQNTYRQQPLQSQCVLHYYYLKWIMTWIYFTNVLLYYCYTVL